MADVVLANYSFNKTAKTVTFKDYGAISLERIKLITNLASNTIIYNFAGSGKGGTVAGNVLTLAYDTSAMANSDPLMVIYNDDSQQAVNELSVAIRKLLMISEYPPWVQGGKIRVIAEGSDVPVTQGAGSASVTPWTFSPSLGDLPNPHIMQDSWAVSIRNRFS